MKFGDNKSIEKMFRDQYHLRDSDKVVVRLLYKDIDGLDEYLIEDRVKQVDKTLYRKTVIKIGILRQKE